MLKICNECYRGNIYLINNNCDSINNNYHAMRFYEKYINIWSPIDNYSGIYGYNHRDKFINWSFTNSLHSFSVLIQYLFIFMLFKSQTNCIFYFPCTTVANISFQFYSTPTLHNEFRLKCQNDAFTEGIPMNRIEEQCWKVVDLLLVVKVLTQLPLLSARDWLICSCMERAKNFKTLNYAAK